MSLSLPFAPLTTFGEGDFDATGMDAGAFSVVFVGVGASTGTGLEDLDLVGVWSDELVLMGEVPAFEVCDERTFPGRLRFGDGSEGWWLWPLGSQK